MPNLEIFDPRKLFRRSEQRVIRKSPQEIRREQQRFEIRRRIIIGGATALGLGMFGVTLRHVLTEPSLPSDNEFDGSVEQTQQYLQEWNSLVGNNEASLEAYLPKMIDLSISYYSRQMKEIFPHRASQYDRIKFLGRINVVDEHTLEKEDAVGACVASSPNNLNFISFEDPFRDLIFFSPKRVEKISQASKTPDDLIKNTFVVLVHELAHFSAKNIAYNPGIHILGISKPVDYQKGLTAFTKDQVSGKECHNVYWLPLEETVVEDAITRLVERVGVQNKISVYGKNVRLYRGEMLPLIDGDFRPLFEYQQVSDRDGLLRKLGGKLGQQNSQRQLETGTLFAANLLK